MEGESFFDFEDEEIEEEASEGPQRWKGENWTWPCPECGFRSAVLEELGAHLERHRQVLPERRNARGRPVTMPCPKGCGRNFPCSRGPETPKRLSEHAENCDGSSPAVPVVLAQGA